MFVKRNKLAERDRKEVKGNEKREKKVIGRWKNVVDPRGLTV